MENPSHNSTQKNGSGTAGSRRSTSSKIFTHVVWTLAFSLLVLNGCSAPEPENLKPRILVSSDIGGTDPDDFQSMIHLFMYANLFQIEGLV